ncbi:uncharacterized protein LOC108091905 [Drosophila ficusphila]|uniref:uncharacterized protein LOC108091905 n=1 Tax=Drosophila ficusphila TaxID=30025 RepID=UPI0007E779E4|nr:uncharacterized protein LOC108091905 [Drosophila ficusphila]
MHSLGRIYVLILLYFNLFGNTLQDNTTIAEPTPAAPQPITTIADPTPAAPPGKDPDTAKPEISKESSSSKCKSTEILSENGCVDREYFLDKIIMRSWKDEGFGKAKARAGLVDVGQCKSDEVRTPYGCAKPPIPPHRDSNRIKVQHSRLSHNKILNGIPISKVSRQEDDGERKVVKKPSISGPPITGEKRPRKYVFMPGRTLRKGSKCRPNEVLGRRSRCIRRSRKRKEREEEDT